VAQVIASVNLPPEKVIRGIGELICTFSTSSHGGIATETQRRVQRFDPVWCTNICIDSAVR
jgi:hypothetical protein